MAFPADRPRRLRRKPGLRRLVAETTIEPRRLIQPLFVEEGRTGPADIPSLPGQRRHGIASLVEAARDCHDVGVGAVLLFGIPARKSADGAEAWNDDGVVQQAVRAIRSAVPELVVMADLCLCEYTDHGHCGVLRGDTVDNDATLPLYARTAVSYARAGVDVVAPSGMQDGTVAALREALDDAGHEETAILSYAVKYASAFYGPFREAAGSAPGAGDRKGYQMDPRNGREAFLEAELDETEGADLLMVKPAGPYLDVITRVRERTDRPLAAYQVSGEYALLAAGAAAGVVDLDAALRESVTGIFRAGADLVITYAARDLAREARRPSAR